VANWSGVSRTEIGGPGGEDELEQAAQRQRGAEAGDHQDDGAAAAPQAAEQQEVERQGEEAGQNHGDKPGRDHRPAEGERADRRRIQ
jgi:hypothetical protein